MGIQLSPDELAEFLEQSHTLIVSTIRRSGEPLTTPVWYVYLDGAIYFGTPSQSAKVEHLRRDPRVCCLVEEGERWVDLKAVVLTCDAEFVDGTSEEAERIRERTEAKYADFTVQHTGATADHYRSVTYVKLIPRESDVRSWYNRKIRRADESG